MFDIPDEFLPDFVRDEQRVNVLFAPLRSRSVNSKDWESKISSWRTLIQLYCLHNDVYAFTLSSLQTIFIHNGRPPNCLDVVVEELLRNGEAQKLDVFLRKPRSNWSSWFTDVIIKQPVAWSFTKLKSALFTSNTTTDEMYVNLQVIQSKSDALLQNIPQKRKNKLMGLSELLEILHKDPSYVDNLKLLLHSLLCCEKIDVTEARGESNVAAAGETRGLLIKFGDGSKVQAITDVDVAIYALERNEKCLLDSMEILEDDLQNCRLQAKLQLARGHRQIAKSILRKRNDIEKRVLKKSSALHNVQTLLEQMRDIHTDADVLKTYKQAVSAFNNTYQETGLSEDAVEDTMLKLGEMLDLHQDIQTDLGRPVGVAESDSDLEAELAELMKADSLNDAKPGDDDDDTKGIKECLDKLDLNLPDVPVNVTTESAAEVSLIK